MTDVDMGTREAAEVRFLADVDKWIALRQPLIAPASVHKKREVMEREARFQLANSAAFLAWHMRNGETP